MLICKNIHLENVKGATRISCRLFDKTSEWNAGCKVCRRIIETSRVRRRANWELFDVNDGMNERIIFPTFFHRIFLLLLQAKIKELTMEKLESIKKSVKARKLPKTLTLTDQFWEYFKEISTQQYHFNRANVECSLIRKITHQEILDFYEVDQSSVIEKHNSIWHWINFQEHISPKSSTRRSMSIHVIYKAVNQKAIKSQSSLFENYVKVDNIAEFQASMQLYPTMQTKNLRQFYSKKRWVMFSKWGLSREEE